MTEEHDDTDFTGWADYSVPSLGRGLVSDEAVFLYEAFAGLSEGTLDPWLCADMANFAAGYALGVALREGT